MNPPKYLAIVLLVVAFAAGAFAAPPRDAALRALVVGKWQIKNTYSSVLVEGTAEYRADGTFVNSGTMTSGKKTIHLMIEGVWSVKGNILTWIIKKSNTPELQPVGKVGRDEILEIDADHIKYKGIDGQIENETRVKAPSTPETNLTSAEQAGADQRLPSAEKPPVKDQPSTPTSKDAPR